MHHKEFNFTFILMQLSKMHGVGGAVFLTKIISRRQKYVDTKLDFTISRRQKWNSRQHRLPPFKICLTKQIGS